MDWPANAGVASLQRMERLVTGRIKCAETDAFRQCRSPFACSDWGYCRQRNIDAGGMKNVSPAMQSEWRSTDQEASDAVR